MKTEIAMERKTRRLSGLNNITSNNILILRGKPFAKMIKFSDKAPLDETEKWVYYNKQSKETYSFKNGCLIEWNSKPV